ncbi:response regulator [Paenibacillus sp. GCM10023252]|uniref:response regulator n=1 Tax=Paenibacillus sp. GCM10023252 TaxID=3252649 RepID=UPI00361A943E
MNVLLVDDEDYVLDYLKTDVPWSGLGVKDVYVASSAKEAMNLISQTSFDIMISDIRMPEMSGIELLSHIQKTAPAAKVILLSGYSDFTYAVQALQLGAADYLLKPATIEEIVLCLNKVILKIAEEKQAKESLTAAQDVLMLGAARMREHLLLDLILGKKYAPDELSRHLSALHIPLEPNSECMLALLRMEGGAEDSTREDMELLSYAMLNMAEEIHYGSINNDSSLWSCKDYHRYLIVILPVQSEDDYNNKLMKWEKLQQGVRTYLKRTVSLLITAPFTFQHGIHTLYSEALNHFWRLIGTRRDRLVTRSSEQLEHSSEQLTKPLTRLHQSPSLLQLLEAGRWDDIPGRLDYILEELDMPAYQTQHHLMEVLYYLFGSFSYIAHKQGDSFGDMVNIPTLESGAFSFHSTTSIRDWALPLIDQFRRSLKETTSKRNHIIRQIHAFIEEHLHEDVSLGRLGEHVYLHPVYLSRLYKKETGESISTYIERMRMEKAVQLLTLTNMRVSDVAQEVGYQKTQYFIHIFKENYGCTPQNYRNRQ